MRIYTSLDPSLNDWTTAHDIYVPALPAPGSTEEGVGAQEGNAEQVHGSWGLSWCREKWWGSVLAVFTGTNPTVKVGQNIGAWFLRLHDLMTDHQA